MTEGTELPVTNGDERREEGRAAITLKVDYKRLNTFFADYTKNISKGGTFIRTTTPLGIGTEFVFVLTIPEIPEPNLDHAPVHLELTGRVIWIVAEADATENKPAGMGIQFLFKDEAEKSQVESFVAELMKRSLGEHLAEKFLSRGRQ